MNLLLLTPEEAADELVRLSDARATHVREVLGAVPGDTVRVGILEGPIGVAEVVAVDESAVSLCCTFESLAKPLGKDTLLLAIPRPRVLGRCLADAAAMGYGRIVLFRSWRVDKSHLGARVLEADRLRGHLIAGLSQARRNRVPQVHVFPLFKPFVEDELDALVPGPHRFVAHPIATTDTATLRLSPEGPFTLALGPEGGFIPYEVDALAAHGFTPVRAGDGHPLRVETALSLLTGQLQLLRRAT